MSSNAATVLKAIPELPGSTARPEGEKRLETPAAKAPGEVSPVSALAKPEASSSITTHSRETGRSSGVASSTATDKSEDIVRATCKIKIDLADLCPTKEARDLHFKKKCGGPEACAACRAQKIFRDCRREAARVANASIRMRSLMDGLLVDRIQFQEGRAPKAAEWREAVEFAPEAIRSLASNLSSADLKVLQVKCRRVDGKGNTQFYAYPILTRIAPSLSAGIVSMIDKNVSDKWGTERWASLISLEKSPPHYRYTNPIPLRKADVTLTKTTDSRFYLSFSLRSADARSVESISSERKKEFSIPLIARDEYMRETLSLVTLDNARMGALQIQEDRLRPGRWYVRIAYRRTVQKKTDGKAAAINKGMVCFLAGVTETGSQWLYDGDDIESYLKQTVARRQRYQRQVKASSRTGHGRVRTLRPIEHLSGKAERWRETRCQTIARRFTDWLVKEGVGRLYVDDFSGIRDTPPELLEQGQWIWERIQEWPYYQLQMRVSSCCQEEGIEVIIRNPQGISLCCSYCGSRAVTIHKRRIRCGECGKARHLDISAAAVSLAAGERERLGGAAGDAANSVGKKGKKKAPRRTARKPGGKSADPKAAPVTGLMP